MNHSDSARAPWRTTALLLLLAAALAVMVVGGHHVLSPSDPAPRVPADPAAPTALDGAGVETARATATATRFLPGYLAYLRGRRDAQDLRGASAAYRKALALNPPRVSPASRERPLEQAGPPVVTPQAPGRILVTFPVTTRETGFNIPITVERLNGRWAVTSSGDAD